MMVQDEPKEFTVTAENGFLPMHRPLTKLPSQFSELENLLQQMPFHLEGGEKGLLGRGLLGEHSQAIPDYSEIIEPLSVRDDEQLLSALFRDYTFWASAYLLEPCHLHFLRTSNGDGIEAMPTIPSYGLARQRLPANIAKGLCLVAGKLKMHPFMDLYNWALLDDDDGGGGAEGKGMVYENMRIIRKFTGLESERGFILVHVLMVAESPALVKNIQSIMDTLSSPESESDDKAAVVSKLHTAMQGIVKAMKAINKEMQKMWSLSRPQDYAFFRTFIMGIKNQPMFPEGHIIYEGVFDDNNKVLEGNWRGESGANDSIIPSIDILLGVVDEMPENDLTATLKDFQKYRPLGHQKWLSKIAKVAPKMTSKIAQSHKTQPLLLIGKLQIMEQVREFRQRHWQFAKTYIMAFTKHPVATGGSPIVRWLPNQLLTVIIVMRKDLHRIDSEFGLSCLDESQVEAVDGIRANLKLQEETLKSDIKDLQTKFEQTPL